jgi:hypothetical protein
MRLLGDMPQSVATDPNETTYGGQSRLAKRKANGLDVNGIPKLVSKRAQPSLSRRSTLE